MLEKEAFDLEINMINVIGRLDLKNGPLTNLTSGGDGVCGRIVSINVKNLLREKMLGENNPFYGKKHSKETISKISNLNIGKKLSNNVKDKISQSLKGNNNPMFGVHRYGDTNPNNKYIYELSNGKHFWNDLTIKEQKNIRVAFYRKKCNEIKYKNIIIIRKLKT